MCGLVGLYLPDGATAVTADIGAMLASIRHRGPDGTGQHVSPDRRYQCGFTRLAIIDLATGDQPLVDGSTVLMGNGEIYNFRDLRAQFPEHPWRTKGDMEPLLPLWRRDGADFVHHLNGMYGLALYDGDRHALLLVRDRLGVKPLYWARLAGGGLLFASEVKALFASGLVERAVDQQAVGQYLAHGYVPAPATLYRGIRKLPPGHLLRAGRDGTIETERYWRPTATGPVPQDEAEAARHLTGLLDDAVGLQLVSDVPVGALLSGGLDSGLLVALAARRVGRPLNTYTVRFAGAAIDESPLAALVAERYGTRHTVFEVDARDVGAHLPRLAWFCDEPLSDASLLPNQLIEDVLGREIRVALNGTGGDELFAGYGRYFPLAVERRYLRLPAALRRHLVEPLAGLLDPMMAWRLARAGKLEGDRGGYLHDHSTLFPPPILALMGWRHGTALPAQRAAFAAFNGPADTAQLAADLETYLAEDLLTLLDRSSMAASVEGRVPFLDHRLVEAALAVPPAIRAPAGRQKALERAMAAPLLPDAILTAPKQGFASPVAAWMQGGLAAAARRLLCQPRSLERGWWSAAGIDRLLADHRHAPRVYALVMLELAVRLHVESSEATPPSVGLAEMADG